MKKLHIFLSFFLLSSIGLLAQQKEPLAKPKLVVCIVVDGLREDYLSTVWESLDKAGFRRIMEQGMVNKNVSFPYAFSGVAADYASIYTGTYPSYHGITSDIYFDPKTEAEYPCVYDPRIKGVVSPYMVSPRNLLASTFTDELKVATNGKSKIITIALDEAQAVMMAGHAGNGTVWMDNKTGAWTSSDYYGETLPDWANRMNGDGTLNSYLQRSWGNYYIDFYYNSNSIQNGNKASFSYPMNTLVGKYPSYKQFKNTPSANAMVRELAINAIKDEYVGIDEVPDVLNLQFSLKGMDGIATGMINAELQDMYFRLDKDIRLLLDFLDYQIGMSNVLVVVTSGQGEQISPAVLQSYKIPSGYFVSDRSISLLNTYLMAVYGQARWVLGYSNRQIYLNHEVIKEKKLTVEEVQHKVADFMSQFTGVQQAVVVTDLVRLTGDAQFMKYKYAYNRNLSGDVQLFLQPGWVEVANEKQTVGFTGRTNKYVPLMMYGWKVKAQTNYNVMSITDIAPTLCNMLQLPYPNASLGTPLMKITE